MMHELQPGDPQLIGPYRLRGRLGAGGMGQVFLGVSAGGRPVAVKVVRAHLATDPEFRERFRREIAVARKVSGVYTSPVIDADVDGPMPWLATAYVEGPSLADAVMADGPLPAESVLALAKGLAEGLNAIHAAGVVHRDLKPANVLLAQDGPRVIDFGISRAVEASALTLTGLVVGSPGFMSPEQAEGRLVGPPSDIFSLGAVLAFAATGHGPFGTGSTPSLVYRVVYSPPNLDNLPAEVRPLIERCLDKDPAQRPTAAQLLADAGAAHPATAWLPVTRTSVQVPAVTSQANTKPGLIGPASDATRLDLVRPYAPPTMTAAVPSSPGGPTRRQAELGQPARHTRRRAWRPIAMVSISAGLLVGCTYTGMALTSGSGHIMSPVTSTPTPSVSASTSAPPTVTPITSAPVTPSSTPTVTVSPSTVSPSTVSPSTVSPSASVSPTVTVSPSASVSPTVIASASPSPTVTLTTTAPVNTPTPTTTAPAPTTPTPVTTTAAP
jgi:eukaryotic-like serine/threonine-protein kinase